MVRRVFRVLVSIAAMFVIVGAFMLRAAPDFLPPDRVAALVETLPLLYRDRQRQVQVEPPAAAPRATPTVNRMTYIPRSEPADPPEAVAPKPAKAEPAEQGLPVAQRKTVRVGD